MLPGGERTSLGATLRRVLLALATGLAAFLVVGAGMIELASARIEFSLFVVFLAALLVATPGLDVRNSVALPVALPVAAIVGLVVAGAVYFRQRADTADDSEAILP